MKKNNIIVVSIVALVAVLFFAYKHDYFITRPILYKNSDFGYASYKFSVHKKWKLDNRYSYLVLRRKISKDTPESNFNLQIQKVSLVTRGKDVGLTDYFENYYLSELKQIHKANIISIENSNIDVFPAKDIVFTYDLTIQGLTRKVKSRVVIFIAGGYVYSFALGSFENDFPVATQEFEKMVHSFHFSSHPASNLPDPVSTVPK